MAEATIEKALCNRGLAIVVLPAQTLLIRTCDRNSSEFVFKTLSEPLATRPVAGGIARRRWRSLFGRRSGFCRCKTESDKGQFSMSSVRISPSLLMCGGLTKKSEIVLENWGQRKRE